MTPPMQRMICKNVLRSRWSNKWSKVEQTWSVWAVVLHPS